MYWILLVVAVYLLIGEICLSLLRRPFLEKIMNYEIPLIPRNLFEYLLQVVFSPVLIAMITFLLIFLFGCLGIFELDDFFKKNKGDLLVSKK